MNKSFIKQLGGIYAISVLLGCTLQLKTGRYVDSKSPAEIKLNDNGTFEYQYRWHVFFRESKGTWSRIGKSEIELNSYIKEKNFVLSALNKIDDNTLKNTLSLSVSSLAPHPRYYKCFVIMNDSLIATCNCDSIHVQQEKIPSEIKDFFVKIHPISKMPVSFFDTASSNKYFPSQTTRNNIMAKVMVNDSLFNYRVFDKTIISIRRKRISFYDSVFKRNIVLRIKK